MFPLALFSINLRQLVAQHGVLSQTESYSVQTGLFPFVFRFTVPLGKMWNSHVGKLHFVSPGYIALRVKQEAKCFSTQHNHDRRCLRSPGNRHCLIWGRVAALIRHLLSLPDMWKCFQCVAIWRHNYSAHMALYSNSNLEGLFLYSSQYWSEPTIVFAKLTVLSSNESRTALLACTVDCFVS